MMADSPRRRYSRSPSPYKGRSASRSPSRGRYQSRSPSPQPRTRRSRSRSHDRNEAANHGDTLYVTGLASRVTERDLEDHFSKEGKVARCQLIVEPRTRVSRGFAFITMDTAEGAERCIKNLNQSVLEGRYITVEKSRRGRPRTPTPGNYLGLKNPRDNYRGRHRGGYGRDDYGGGYRRSPRRSPNSPYRDVHDFSPRRSPYYDRYKRERSPYDDRYRRERPPYDDRYRRERSRSVPYSPYESSPGRGGGGYGHHTNGYRR